MPYCDDEDLLLGDLRVAGEVDLSRYVRSAAEEIDSKLGVIYKLPLQVSPQPDPAPSPNDWTALPEYQQLLLKNINIKLASGRIIMMLAMSEEQANLHAYALRLVTEATAELLLIANGDVVLDAGRRSTDTTVPDRTPSISNHDAESATEMFEYATMRPEGGYWRPGNPVVGQQTEELYRTFPY